MARTAVVTGGATGIGRAVAEQLVRDGAEVTVIGRRQDVLAAAAAEIGAKAVAFDAADPASVTAALPRLPDTIDVLVNAAGANTDLGADRPADELVATRGSWLANF
jgi:3-oxoacyl-[acyl-carrier protein] reductase